MCLEDSQSKAMEDAAYRKASRKPNGSSAHPSPGNESDTNLSSFIGIPGCGGDVPSCSVPLERPPPTFAIKA